MEYDKNKEERESYSVLLSKIVIKGFLVDNLNLVLCLLMIGCKVTF